MVREGVYAKTEGGWKRNNWKTTEWKGIRGGVILLHQLSFKRGSGGTMKHVHEMGEGGGCVHS